jgi:mono/diheme cytochrome c family protein
MRRRRARFRQDCRSVCFDRNQSSRLVLRLNGSPEMRAAIGLLMVKQMRRTMAMALLLLPLPAAAQDARVGGTLAEHWCMGCHVVERVPPISAPGGAPSFVAIAAKPGTTASSLALYLSSAHTRMPDFSLSGSERDSLVAYILSLR